MKIIRVSDETWQRLQSYAQPFEDKPEDIVNLGLDALDEKTGRAPRQSETSAERAPNAKKLPQKEFRKPLLETMHELGGEVPVKDIRRVMEKKMAPFLNDVDYEPVTSGDPRWWNAVCWERKRLVDEGLFAEDAARGVWKLTVKAELLR